jgi:LysM repeat protein
MYSAADAAHHASGTRRVRPAIRSARRHRARRSQGDSPLAAVGLFLVLSVSLIAVGALPTLADSVPTPAASHAVTVDVTDTLWSIAKANNVAGVPTAEMVEAIRRLNAMAPGQQLQPGAVVRVPVQTDDQEALVRR